MFLKHVYKFFDTSPMKFPLLKYVLALVSNWFLVNRIKELKKTYRNGEINHVHRLEVFVLLKKTVSPNWPVDSPYPNHDPKRLLSINWQVILKCISICKEPRVSKSNLERTKNIGQLMQPNFKKPYSFSNQGSVVLVFTDKHINDQN